MPDAAIVTLQWVQPRTLEPMESIAMQRDAWEWALEEEMCRLGVEAA